jgi:hypothetical protein
LQLRLQERWPAIFEAELDLWCRDRQLWPTPRDFAMFQQWFELRFFPLVEDLGEEALRSFELEEKFEASLRESLG